MWKDVSAESTAPSEGIRVREGNHRGQIRACNPDGPCPEAEEPWRGPSRSESKVDDMSGGTHARSRDAGCTQARTCLRRHVGGQARRQAGRQAGRHAATQSRTNAGAEESRRAGTDAGRHKRTHTAFLQAGFSASGVGFRV